MKRILAILFIIIYFFSFALAQTEFENLDNGLPTNNIADGQILSGISAINARLTTIEQKTDQCLKSSEIDEIVGKIELKSQEETKRMLAETLAEQLIFTAFFFALLFLAKSKRWF